MDWGGLVTLAAVTFLCRGVSSALRLLPAVEAHSSPLFMASMLASARLSDASRLLWRGVRLDRRQLSSSLLSWMEMVRDDGSGVEGRLLEVFVVQDSRAARREASASRREVEPTRRSIIVAVVVWSSVVAAQRFEELLRLFILVR